MASLPTIYTIQASDAPQHTDRLREILQELETENRIKGFITLGVDDDLSTMSDKLKKDDMILILLTNELEEIREQVKKKVNNLKSNQFGLRIAEILADNLIYDNDFITFPDDLRPIRNREDMDEAWSSIARSLRDMFPAKKKEKVKPFPLWIAFVGLGVLLFGVLFIIMLPTASGEEAEVPFTTVPDLAGMSGAEAVSLLLDAGLEAGDRRVESHDLINRELVIRSEPNAGESIEIGAQVELIFSGGREQIRVPELTGMTLSEAYSVLERDELRIGRQPLEYSDEIEQGRVIRTDPSASSAVNPGSQINLVTSLGPSASPAPPGDFPEKQSEYEVILKSAGANKIAVIKEVRGITGLGLRESKELVDNAPKLIKKGVGKEEAEKLKAQLEEAGAEVDISRKSLIISNGRDLIEIPVLEGLLLEDAITILENVGLQFAGQRERNSDLQRDIVIASRPSADSEVAPGTSVLLYVSAGPPSVDTSFRLVVEDVFSVTGRGTVVIGRIQTGITNTGDHVHILSSDEQEVKQKTIITGIESGGVVEVARAGAQVGLLLRGINREEVERGDVVIGIP